MQDNVTVLEMWERPVYLVDSGNHTKSLMVVISFQRPHTTPLFVLMRKIYTPNATDATDSYTLISGATSEDWKQKLEEQDLMILSPGLDLTSGPKTS